MKIKTLLVMLLSIMLVCCLANVANAQTTPQKDDGERDERVSPKDREEVKISIEQARKTVLERVRGTIIEEELEKEDGRIVYSIEVRQANQKVFDVEVDAKTGAIVKVEEETDDDEGGEDDNDEAEEQKETKEKAAPKNP